MKPMNFPLRRHLRHLEAILRNTNFRIRTSDPRDPEGIKKLVDQRQSAIDGLSETAQYRDIRTKKKRS